MHSKRLIRAALVFGIFLTGWSGSVAAAIPITLPVAICGDGTCNGSETAASCPGDCTATPQCPASPAGFNATGQVYWQLPDSTCYPDTAVPASSSGTTIRVTDTNTTYPSSATGSAIFYCSGTTWVKQGGTCNLSSPPAPYCGDGTCNGSETSASCSSDCGAPPPTPYCGDGTCNGSETTASCQGDCPSSPPPSGQHLCGGDANRDGNIDQNEIATCDDTYGGYLCPIQRQACVPAGPFPGSAHICPVSGGGPCMDTGGGNYMCSPNQCFDKGSTPTETTDVNQTTPTDNGPRDGAGNCLAKLRIFPGAGKRCHKAGNQTVWQNCCKNDMPKLNDTMGKSGDKPQREYKDESSHFEFWSNQCDIQDQETSLLADSGYCIYLGEFCAEKWPFVGCVQKDQSYCCFNSLLAKMVQEQGRSQLPAMGGFGSPAAPVCRGFSPEEFQAIDFSKIDLSGYYSTLQFNSQSVIQTQAQDEARQKINSR